MAAGGVWLVSPDMIWGLVAGVGAGLAVAWGVRSGRPAKLVVSFLGLAGAGAAVHASWQVQMIEDDWDAVREGMVVRAGARLGDVVANAIAQVEVLAERGVALSEDSRPATFDHLDELLAVRSPERGVVVYRDEEVWAWAGRFKVPVEPEFQNLIRVRMTPFHVVVEAERVRDGRIAVAQLILAADSAVPEREGTLATRFQRTTGTDLRFFFPGEAPAGADIFDACLPACDVSGESVDTLLSIRVVPPTQGTMKLAVLERGGRRVAVTTALALVVYFWVIPVFFRLFVVVGGGMLLLWTPMGARLGVEPLFSSRTYFFPALGLLSSSAGHLVVVTGLLLVLSGTLWPVWVKRRRFFWLGMPIIAVVVPYVIRGLTLGVVVPEEGTTIAGWLSWTVGVGLVATALLLFGALFGRFGGIGKFRWWTAWLAGFAAFVLVFIGFLLWRPGPHWPTWYVVAWMPVMVLAMQPARHWRTLVSCTIVGTASAAVFLWGRTVEGQLLNADRDVSRLVERFDPLAVSGLEILGLELSGQPLPVTAGELYAAWRTSSLSRDEYPASLVTWDSSGVPVARLDLASLEVSDQLVRSYIDEIVSPINWKVEELNLLFGVHYLLLVPAADGYLVSVVVGPRSQLIKPERLARFLQGTEFTSPQYEVFFEEHPVQQEGAGGFLWIRDGNVLRGEQQGDTPSDTPHIHVHVEMSNWPDLLVRGSLLVAVNILLAGFFWLTGEVIRGRATLDPVILWHRVKGETFRRRLTAALGLFFFVPAVVFALWSLSRLRTEMRTTRDLVIRQTLRDAAATAQPFGEEEVALDLRLQTLAERLDADLFLFENGQLLHSSAPTLSEFALIEPFLPPVVYRSLVLGESPDPEITVDRNIGGRWARVGYRTLTVGYEGTLVLGTPRLVADEPFGQSQLDITYVLLLVVVVGFASASGLAATVGRALATPVQALSDAASAVGRGDKVSSIQVKMPSEFVPVVTAFERMAEDVSAHQGALERALEFTEAVLSNMATGVIALRNDLFVTTVNPSAIGLVGTELNDHEPVDEQTAEEWAPVWQWIRAFNREQQEGDATEFTVGERRIRAHVAPLPGEEGGVVLALEDATELAVAERVLAWGEMARQVAHEIKNPLTPIRLGVQHLLRTRRDKRHDFDDVLDKTSQQILAEIERLDAIARAFSRFGAPPAKAEPMAAVDVVQIAGEAASLYTLSGGAKVDVRAKDELFGMVRKDELKEVLINLIENARDAEATEVVIEIEALPSSQISFSVYDNGKGIPKENLARIFEPQFSTNTSGTGLGLAICRRLVESWGGDIRAAGALDGGTTISFTMAEASAAD